MDHVLWTDDFRILIKHVSEFWPDNTYTVNRKINASVRYIIYSSILLSYLYKNTNFIVIGIVLSLCITFILKNCTSSYDPKSIFIKLYKTANPKMQKDENFNMNQKEKTIIFVSHNSNILSKFNKVINFDKGVLKN